jgi:hypothetical protein
MVNPWGLFPSGPERRLTAMKKLMWAVFAVGVLLIAAPLAIGLPRKADGGQKMIDAFKPLMNQNNVDVTAEYYNDVFVPLGNVVPAMSQENIDTFNGYVAGFEALGVDAQNMVPALAGAMGMSEADVQAFMADQFPAMSATLQGLPQMQQDFSGLLTLMDDNVGIFERVPAGLDHYKPLVTTMQAEVGNYDKVASLPDFRLFTWFFVIPGAILVALATAGLRFRRDTHGDDVLTVERVLEPVS